MVETVGDAVTWHPERPKYRPLRVVLAWLLSAAALFVAAAIIPHVSIDFLGAVLVAALIGILNAVLPPLIAALRLPLMARRLRAMLVLDALMLLASAIRPESITVDNFGWALLAALVAAAVTVVARGRLRDERRRHLHAPGRAADRPLSRRRGPHRRRRHRLPRDRRACAAGPHPRDARRQRPDDGALARTRATGSSSGSPTCRRRRARARPGSCWAPTRTYRPSAGWRRRRGR